MNLKTCSPLLIREIKPGEKPVWLGFDDPVFGEWLEKSVGSLSKKFLGKSGFNVGFTPLKCKAVYLNHYKGLVKATVGKFVLDAPQDVIKILVLTITKQLNHNIKV